MEAKNRRWTALRNSRINKVMHTDQATFATGNAESRILASPLQFVKGVGPAKATLLARLNLHTIQDLLFHFPVSHVDRKEVTPIRGARVGQSVNLVAQIIDVKAKRFSGKEQITALLRDANGDQLQSVWWNPWVADRLTPNRWGFFSGKMTAFAERKQLSNAEFEILDDGELDAGGARTATGPSFGRIVPIYNLRPKTRSTEGALAPEIRMNQNILRKVVWKALEDGAAEQLLDQLPEWVRQSRGLMGLAETVRKFHFPETWDERNEARHRLVFEELYVISLGVALRRAQVERAAGALKLPLGPTVLQRIEARLPFTLTNSQRQAFSQIAADMGGSTPMNRLLQGDVGSGKTAVAVAALLLCVAHGHQAVLLAPTEALALQHHRTLTKLLQNSRVEIGLLNGGMKLAARNEFLDRLKAGTIHIALGTHALLEPGVEFKSMALAIVDEQHKFGVRQRMTLRAKGRAPHVLVMTATPIPRTLTLTLYGDLDLSVLSEPPPGRGEIVTKWMDEADRPKLHRLIIEEARKGHSTYVVLPRIKGETYLDSDEEILEEEELPPSAVPDDKPKKKRLPKSLWGGDIKGAEQEFKRLKDHLPTLRVELLHGRLASAEKQRVLELLAAGKIDVLVSTQVIEVGIDLPTATVMVIENADRFGLSALHQLRGRVGRSERKSWCLFFADSEAEDARERLKAFEKTRDGFQLAETDFKIRGPGQFFGTNQSGMPELKVADLLTDTQILAEALEAAKKTAHVDPTLKREEHAELKQRLKEVLGRRIGLVDVG